MVALVLLSLTAGIATTIGTVALVAILFRSSLADRLPRIERKARILQGVAGAVILAIALWTGVSLLVA